MAIEFLIAGASKNRVVCIQDTDALASIEDGLVDLALLEADLD
jgi:hypothetical protein